MTEEARRVATFFFRARLDLPDALAREMQPVADLLQRARLLALEAEAQPDDLALPAVEIAQRRRQCPRPASTRAEHTIFEFSL
jgi:hypothetical protein